MHIQEFLEYVYVFVFNILDPKYSQNNEIIKNESNSLNESKWIHKKINVENIQIHIFTDVMFFF